MGVAFGRTVSNVSQSDEARGVADRWHNVLAIERRQPRCARRLVAAVIVVVARVRHADNDIIRPLTIATRVRRRLPLDHTRPGRRVDMARGRRRCQQRQAGARNERARETGRGRRDERQAEDRAQNAPTDSDRMSGEPARRLDDHLRFENGTLVGGTAGPLSTTPSRRSPASVTQRASRRVSESLVCSCTTRAKAPGAAAVPAATRMPARCRRKTSPRPESTAIASRWPRRRTRVRG